MTIEEGSVIKGKVSRITNFGAFIELGNGKNGLVHISEVANEYVRDVHDFLSEGDEVDAKVLGVDEKGKIALSLKNVNTQSQESERQIRSPKVRQSAMFSERKPNRQTSSSFEDKLSKFLKDSDERLTDLKRKTDSKRGGRGSRRSD